MSLKQLTIFVENKKGSLVDITKILAENNVNLRALSIADTQDFGILRIICEDPDKANEVLRDGGFLTTTTKVLAAPISDEPGSLASVLEVLSESNVMVEYTYAFLSEKHGAYMILRVDDNQMAAAALAGAGIKTVDRADLF